MRVRVEKVDGLGWNKSYWFICLTTIDRGLRRSWDTEGKFRGRNASRGTNKSTGQLDSGMGYGKRANGVHQARKMGYNIIGFLEQRIDTNYSLIEDIVE